MPTSIANHLQLQSLSGRIQKFILSGHHISFVSSGFLPACFQSCELRITHALEVTLTHDHSLFLCTGTSKNRGYPKKHIQPRQNKRNARIPGKCSISECGKPPSSTKTQKYVLNLATPQWGVLGLPHHLTPSYTYDHPQYVFTPKQTFVFPSNFGDVPSTASLPRRGKSPPASYNMGTTWGYHRNVIWI